MYNREMATFWNSELTVIGSIQAAAGPFFLESDR